MNLDTLTEAVDPILMRCQLRVGSLLRDKWRLDVLLGVGGMAAVYAATHRNGTRAAIKILHPELSTHNHIRARFVREGYVANRIEHRGAVRVIDDDVAEDGSLFLVMELLDGESLEERRERLGGTLEVDEALAAADQLLDVLAAAHEKGIVHRDIKPENIFLTREGAVKVLDFGIARLREVSAASGATRDGTSMGTPAFMPPEQARALWDEVDARSDIWSVGATIFTLVTGRVVHNGRTSNEQLLSAMTKPAPSIGSVAPQVPAAAAAVIDRALAFAKDDRWCDAREMQHALRIAYHTVSDEPVSAHPALVVPPSVRNRTVASATDPMPAVAGSSTGPAVSSGVTGVALRVLATVPRPVVLVVALASAIVFAVASVATVRFAALRASSTPAPMRSSLSEAQAPIMAGRPPMAREAPAAERSADADPATPASDNPPAPSVTAKPKATRSTRSFDWRDQRK